MRRRIVLWPACGALLVAVALLWRMGAADRPRVGSAPVAEATAPAAVPLATVFARPAAVTGVEAPVPRVARCRIVERGALPEAGAFGHPFASHVHISYRAAGAEAERDVMLAGGVWQPEAGVAGGRYRLYAGCTDREVRRKILIYQRQINREEPGINAGWGNPRAFAWVAVEG